MAKPSQTILDFMAKYGVDSDEIWEVHGSTWVIKHKALERVAAELGVTFDRPDVIACDLEKKSMIVCTYGKLGDKTEWSFGEATPANCKNAYFAAMAEKRSRDRVILKLLVSHGALYSESEADEFASSNSAGSGPAKRTELPKKDAKGVYTKLQAEIQSSVSRDQLKEWGKANADRIEVLPEDWRDILRMQYEEQMADLRQREAA